jgi:hypothetical protein
MEAQAPSSPIRVSCLLDALRLPPVELRGKLFMQCLDERDRRTFVCRALLTGAALYLLLPPSAREGRLHASWRILPLVNATVGPVRLDDLGKGVDGRFPFEVEDNRGKRFLFSAATQGEARDWWRRLRDSANGATEANNTEVAEVLGADHSEAASKAELAAAAAAAEVVVGGGGSSSGGGGGGDAPPALRVFDPRAMVDARTVGLPPRHALLSALLEGRPEGAPPAEGGAAAPAAARLPPLPPRTLKRLFCGGPRSGGGMGLRAAAASRGGGGGGGGGARLLSPRLLQLEAEVFSRGGGAGVPLTVLEACTLGGVRGVVATPGAGLSIPSFSSVGLLRRALRVGDAQARWGFAAWGARAAQWELEGGPLVEAAAAAEHAAARGGWLPAAAADAPPPPAPPLPPPPPARGGAAPEPKRWSALSAFTASLGIGGGGARGGAAAVAAAAAATAPATPPQAPPAGGSRAGAAADARTRASSNHSASSSQLPQAQRPAASARSAASLRYGSRTTTASSAGGGWLGIAAPNGDGAGGGWW